MSIKAKIMIAILNKDSELIYNIYKDLVSKKQIKPFKIDINLLMRLIKNELLTSFTLQSCIIHDESDLSLRLLQGVYLFIDLLEYDN